MTGIGMNLTEYTSAELAELQLAILARIERLNKIMETTALPDIRQRQLDQMNQWEVKVFEAKQIVLKREVELLN